MNEIQRLLQTGKVYETDQGGAGGIMLGVAAVHRLQQIGFEYEELLNKNEDRGENKK